ncbi:hypothetical protein [Salinarchaeum laminariae]|uniref:hypothetical protein n=1 Tax=Salinarchaeum laminariae TaxID=869888 RepID=UPI0020BD83B8|nr:hypothetical protein [Salinarchaeum laminariae]
MERSRVVAASIGLLALLLGWLFLQMMTPRTSPDSQPFVETVSFALSTPAGLVFLTYLTGVFEFDRYFGDRSGAGLFGDFFLSLLAAAAIGILATALIIEVTTTRQVVFVGASFATFIGGFGQFVIRTREFFDWEQAAAEGTES